MGPVKKSLFACKRMPPQPGVNDENRDVSDGLDATGFLRVANCAPGPEAIEIEYVRTEDLADTVDAEADGRTLLDRLDSKDWVTVCQALNNVRQLSLFHSVAAEVHLSAVVPKVLKAVKNPRSALQKTSLMALADMFLAFGDKMLESLDSLLLQLFLKASQDKQFVCEEADRTLSALSASLSPAAVLEKLLPYSKHKNPRVRAKATVSIHDSVARLGPDGIESFGWDRLVQVTAGQVSDQLPEAREAARKLIGELYAAYAFCYQAQPENTFYHTPPEPSRSEPDPDDMEGTSGNALQEGLADVASPGTGEPQQVSEKANEGETIEAAWGRFCSKFLSPLDVQAILRVFSSRQ
ncbi:hypothetical protein KFL_004460090 [Klebsormidium nitens]|uniref:TOG domain-containing protein n=1 Tax=Klebsormidium nitens TaxID=105231 RepID=A0A1Y1ICE4_KLENI|nr:hypothetical protein KFL_004460090 [Klebsormidium nitens]|eukprot:GAQ88635.1 hypothetical protein KFL_004460090 [Klebsormidium nitens]